MGEGTEKPQDGWTPLHHLYLRTGTDTPPSRPPPQLPGANAGARQNGLPSSPRNSYTRALSSAAPPGTVPGAPGDPDGAPRQRNGEDDSWTSRPCRQRSRRPRAPGTAP